MTQPTSQANSNEASPQHNVVSALPEMAQSQGDNIALSEAVPEILAKWTGPESPIDMRSITWGELDNKVALAAGGFRRLGLEPGDRVVIFVPMSIDLYISMLGLFRMGAIAVFLDSFARQHQLGQCASLVEPKAFIGNELAQTFRPAIPELANLTVQVVTGTTEAINDSTPLETMVSWGEQEPIAPVEPEATALVTFTTGSSGVPKGANRTHRFLRAQHEALNVEIPYRDGDSDLPAFPIFLLNNLAAGITTVMPAIDLAIPNEQDPVKLVSQLKSGTTTSATLSPAMLGRVSRYCIDNEIRLESLWRMVTGGAPVGPDMVRDFNRAVPNAELAILYGSTEAEPICYITGSQMMEWIDEPGSAQRQGVCVGRFAQGLHARLVTVTKGRIELRDGGWEDWDVGVGEPGEVLVAGNHVCRDYFRNPEAVARNKISDGPLVWHRTGDVGYRDDQDRLWLVGRVHNAISRGDGWFFPVEAEQVLARMSFAGQTAFLGLPDADLGERTAAVYVPSGDAANLPARDAAGDTSLPACPASEAAEIRSALEARSFIVDEVWAVEKIPMDPRHHSKVDYDALRRHMLQASGMSEEEAAQASAAMRNEEGGDDPGAAGFGAA